MKYRALISTLIAIALFTSCSGNSANLRETAIIRGPLEIAPVEDSNIETVTWSKQPGNLDFAFRNIPPEGTFLELHLPDGIYPGGQTWLGTENVIAQMFFRNGTMQIGAVPFPSYKGTRISVSIPIYLGFKQVLAPPVGERNELVDLSVSSTGDGNVQLSWTEVNTGDYDFNSEVNVADLTPIVIHFAQTVAGGTDQSEYWVDGDRNGEINAADITPIALNFLNTVNGYNIRLNGDIAVNVSRQDSIQQDGLPPKYQTVLPGSVLDEWTVIPVDDGGLEGQPTVVIPPAPDTKFEINLSGINFYDTDGSGFAGTAGQGRVYCSVVEIDPLRRILPGEDPDGAGIGNAVGGDTLLPEFYDLPAAGQFALLLEFLPAVDLGTGDPRIFDQPPGKPLWEYEPNVLILPFDQVGHIKPGISTVSVSFAPGPFSSYIGDVEVAGGTLVEGHFRIDYGDSVLIRDANGNGDFEDEARMLEEFRRGVTKQRLDQLGQLLEYSGSAKLGLTLTATVGSYDVTRGIMELIDVNITYDGPEPPAHLGNLVLNLSEFTTFASRPGIGGEETPISPEAIDPGVSIEATGYRLVEIPPDLPDVYWGEHVVKIIL